jgi:hypothetical protein
MSFFPRLTAMFGARTTLTEMVLLLTEISYRLAGLLVLAPLVLLFVTPTFNLGQRYPTHRFVYHPGSRLPLILIWEESP